VAGDTVSAVHAAEEPRSSLPYLFLAPALLLVALVSLYPIGYALHRSLYATRYLALGRFVGAGNYVSYFLRGSGWQNLCNSLVFTLGSLALTLPIGTTLAIALNRPLPLRALVRTVLVLPWIVSQAIVGLLWTWLFNPDFGPVSYAARQWFGIRLSLFGDPDLAMLGTILANVWQSYPLALILMLAALQGIPVDVFEMARMDGASAWQTFWRVILPLVRPTLLITAIMLTLHNFNMVTLIVVLTGGGPDGVTETLSVKIFNEAFQFQNLGLACAVGLIVAALNIVFSLAYLRVLRPDATVTMEKELPLSSPEGSRASGRRP
jgi:multiple sugar transport system permease protein